MKWKSVLAAFLLLSLFIVIAYPYVSGTDLAAGEFPLSGLFSYIKFQKETGPKFGFALIANSESLKDQELSFANATFIYEGGCYLPASNIEISGKCKITAPRVSGKISLGDVYEMKIEPVALNINGLTVFYSGERIVLSNVEKLSLSQVESNELTFVGATGQINNTKTGAIQPLQNSEIKISSYGGLFLITNQTLKLIGFASLIEGDGFVWKG